VAKANYHQIRRQKELARKARQQEKQQKREAARAAEPLKTDADGTAAVAGAVLDPADTAEGSSGS
jgi:hypothetical protein